MNANVDGENELRRLQKVLAPVLGGAKLNLVPTGVEHAIAPVAAV